MLLCSLRFAQEYRLSMLAPGNMMEMACITVNSEKIALVEFLRLSSDAKLKFPMISAATLSVLLALHVRKFKKRKNIFSEDSQN